jgi:hypothetical protein
VSASPRVRFESAETAMRSFWLPHNAHGNGLDASAWAAIAEIEPRRVEPLLQSLAARGVPACAAPVPDGPGRGLLRIFVDPARHASAENVLLSELSRPAPQPVTRHRDPAQPRRCWLRRLGVRRSGRSDD